MKRLNKMKKCLTTCALAAFAAISAVAADADIRSIDAVDDRTIPVSYPNGESPLKAGQPLYILVRLLNQDYAETIAGGDPHPWYFKPRTAGSVDLSAAIYVPKLALSIGGKRCYAEYSATGPNGELSGLNRETDSNGRSGYHTDLYFKHTVEPGEFGGPIKLLGKDGRIGDGTHEFQMVNVNTGDDAADGIWNLTNDSATPRLATLRYVNEVGLPDSIQYPSQPHDTPHTSSDFRSEGVYVQTISFDSTFDDEDANVWREVYPGLSSAVLNAPRIEGTGPATVYVWSENEDVFTPVGEGRFRDAVSDRWVLPVVIPGGDSAVSFKMRGGTAPEGSTCKIYMSSATSAGRTDVGDPLDDSAASRIVRMHAAPTPKVSFQINGQPNAVNVTCPTNYEESVAQLTVRLEPAVEHDVWVDLTATLNNTGDLQAIYDATLLRISENDGGDAYEDTVMRVKIPANTSVVPLYLYSLGWTDDTSRKGIVFKPGAIWTDETGTAADAEVTASTAGCVLKVTALSPTILDVEPGLTGSATAVGGASTQFFVTMSDCYRNIMDQDQGYTFYWRSSDGEELAPSEGIVAEADGSFILNQKFFTTGKKTITLYAVHPNNNRKSASVSFDLEVGKAKQISASFPGEQPWRTPEGVTLPVSFALEGGTASVVTYAFLEPANDATARAVDTSATPFSAGVAIEKGSTAASFQPEIKFLDGTQPCEFTVKLSRTRETYSKVPGFEDSTLFITVTNVLPRVTSVTAGGMPVSNGATLSRSVPKGVETTFRLTASDVTADLDAAEPDVFLTKWVIYDGVEKTYFTRGNPNGQVVRHEFKNDTIGGEGALVQVYLKDKDTTDYSAIPDFSFRVPVSKTPRVTLAYESADDTGVWFETEKNDHGIVVGLSAAATADLVVRVKANRSADGGYVKFKTRTGVVEDDPANEGWYNVRFPAGTTSQTLTVTELDGTQDSAAGLDIEALVITDEDSGYGKKWSEYYEAANPISPKVVNKAPVGVTTPLDGSTNVNAKVYAPYTVSYKVGSDVKADLAGGITVVLSVDGDEVESVPGVTDTARHQFTKPVQFTSPGLHVVTVTFTDKDEGSSTCTMFYDVMQTKTVVVAAHDPASARASANGHSGRYDRAKGLGAGRVDGESLAPQSTKDWASTFSVAVSDSSLPVVARGYQVTDAANATVDVNGSFPLTAAAYRYADHDARGKEGYDSFFYAWVCNNSATSDGIELEKDLMVVPSLSMAYAIPTQPYEDDKKSYDTQYWEAVFSKEWLTSDNCGDINGDGIPDLYLATYGFGVLNVKESTLEGDDLESLADYNADEDYFPNTATAAGASFIPGLSNTWATVGTPFEARFEIRGWYGKGGEASVALNDAPIQAGFGRSVSTDIVFTDPATDDNSTLSPVEWWAFTNYCARIGRDPADAAIWAGGSDPLTWSPERPTDPTKADTDNDGFPDGYEYYIWYRSHVGYSENGAYKKLTGRRYRPEDPLHPEVITAEEIASLYDPRHDLSGAASPGLTTDTDNDGLTDWEELAIGTNPFDFDTDGDGLPDGYEILLSKTDPLMYSSASSGGVSDGEANLDGDAMAYAPMSLPRIGFISTNSYDVVSNRENDVWIPVTNSFSVVTNSWFGDAAWGLFAEDAAGANPRVCYFVNGADGRRYLTLEPVSYKVDKERKTATVDKPAQVYDTWQTNVVKDVRYYSSDAATVDVNGLALNYAKPVECEPEGFYQGWDYAAGVLAAGVKCGSADITNLLGRVVSVVDSEDVVFMHFGAYQKLGFNPLTAVHWTAVNTKRYTNYDEFMLITFLYRQKLIADSSLVQTSDTRMTAIWQKFTTDPLLADSNADGTPDGWKLYTLYGPNAAPTGLAFSQAISKLSALYPIQLDPDADGLTFSEEFAGILSTGFYPESDYCSTITLTDAQKKWRNKLWPTDPWNADTDDDGIPDGEEGQHFIYGTEGVAGGGLNPLSWDTDGDGLPDPWELEFAGTWSAGGSSTNATASATNSVSASEVAWNNDGMDGTVSDAYLDYDDDGLLNWQEYMVGAMRCWRYDDTVSQWSSHFFDKTLIPDESDETAWGEFWYKHLLDEQNGDGEFTPQLSIGGFDARIYFSLCTNAWDFTANNRYYMFKDGVYHDLRRPSADKYWVKTSTGDVQYNRFTYKVHETTDWGDNKPEFCSVAALYPVKYITCDPTKSDTDGDGMDDYYELFHGMNPLLGLQQSSGDGPRDLVFEAYIRSPEVPAKFVWHACNNFWLNESMPHRPFRYKNVGSGEQGGNAIWDFEAFPWLGGLAAADPDGDNIRNQQEAIMPGLQAASTYLHTDPTPLWMTDTSYPGSLTARCYWPTDSAVESFESETGTFVYRNRVYRFDDIPGFVWDKTKKKVSFTAPTANNWGVLESPYFSYEENEGYDTDHDYLSDYEESQGRTKSASDPQDSDSPLRRQAMWFGGAEDPSFLQSHVGIREETPAVAANAERRENFLYYTVECWAKPDATVLSESPLHTVVERAVWVNPSGPADQKYIRKNFLIGVKNGKWYTKYDSAGTDKNQPVAITEGPVATTNWTHVCATYDGKALRLYVNGVCENGCSKNSSVQPEHGIAVHTIEGDGTFGNYYVKYNYISYLIGASAQNLKSIFFDYAQRFPLGENPTFEDYGNYYKGYVDEVRIWDGARSAADIEADYKNRTRYSAEQALANRQEVFEAWREGGSRVESAPVQLPPELKYHWSFDHLPGAVGKGDVTPVPAGFATSGTVTDAKAVWVRPEGYVCPWWQDIKVRSQVYTDTAWVPWINNTVSHLPRLDGTTVDSVYWSKNFAGLLSAVDRGFPFFTFPRSAEPYSRWTQLYYKMENADEYTTTSTRWKIVENDNALCAAYRFARRDRNVLGDDLLPMGGAYPKRISTAEGGMWDDQGAADAWAQTGSDRNNRGLPDWWSRYAKSNYVADPTAVISWETVVDYNGRKMTAGEAYRYDLARGMLPDAQYHPEFADTRDFDHDQIPDWWEDLYGINTGSAEDRFADADGDGLSNYAEYLISEVFNFATISPIHEKSDGVCPDYFRRVGDLYLGEIFTDYDQVDDQWERKYAQADVNGILYANHYVHDPQKDLDNDGWSNFAESKVGTDPSKAISSKAISSGIGDGYFIREYPVPTIDATVVYNGKDAITAPIVFKAWSKKTDSDMTSIPDAIWTVANVSSNVEGATNTRYLGMKPAAKSTYTLGTGMVTPGSVRLYFRDLSYRLVSTLSGYDYLSYRGDVSNSKWYAVVADQWTRDGGLLYATIVTSAGATREVLVGSVDYTTGVLTIDFSNAILMGYSYFATEEVPAGASHMVAQWYDKINLNSSYVYIAWGSQMAGADASGTYHLSDANGSGEQRGYIREGLNKFVVFVDKDGDGEYTPGEPFGFVDNVDVGWEGARFTVELTETHPTFARIDLRTGESDREYHWQGNSGLTTNETGIVLGDSLKERVRVVRTAVNGYGINKFDSKFLEIEGRVVMDKVFDLNVRSYLHEGDFIDDTEFDLDWSNFETEVYNNKALNLYDSAGNWLLDPTNVMYRIVLGDGSVLPNETNRLFRLNVSRTFDATVLRTVPEITGCAVEGIYYNSRPTFSWTMHGFNSYPAFQLQILAEDGAEVIYDSGIRRAPKVDKNDCYQWTADCSFGDQTPQGKILSRRGNYKCRVTMYNAKFRRPDWSKPVAFSAAVNSSREMNDHGYSSIDVLVKYAGPSNVLDRIGMLNQSKGIIRVQAFPGADFSGEPLAQTFVTNVIGSSITDMTLKQPNARLTGLPANGTYYIRAYVDLDGDFRHSAWESWGSAKAEIVLSDTDKNAPVATVYIEDADTDGDWIPDAYEYVRAGWTGSWESVKDKIQSDVTGNENVLFDIETFIGNRGGLSAGMSGVPVTIFQNGSYAKILLGLSGGSLTTTSLRAALRNQAKIDSNSVKITSLTLDPAANRVVLTVTADVQPSVAGQMVSQVYGLSVDSKTVSLKVYEKKTLAEADWSLMATKSGVTVGNGQSVVEVPLDPALDFSSGFYKIEVVEED